MLTHRAPSLASSQLFLWHQFPEPNYCHGLTGLQHGTVSTRQSYLSYLLGPGQFCWAGHTEGNVALHWMCEVLLGSTTRASRLVQVPSVYCRAVKFILCACRGNVSSLLSQWGWKTTPGSCNRMNLPHPSPQGRCDYQ